MPAPIVNTLGIDTYTKKAPALIRRLARLKATHSCRFAGAYREDPNLCQIHILTTWDEAQLEDWLWATKGIDYIGTFKLVPCEEPSDGQD